MSTQVPTLKEIAKRLNISVSAVSRALHNHPSIGLRTRTRVKELAAALHYEPNQVALSFKRNKTCMIGVILPNLNQDFFAAIVSAIEDVAYRKNYTLLLGQSRDEEDREKRLVESMKSQRVDGVLVSIAKNTSNYAHFDLLKKANIPVVFFDRIPRMPDIHYIASELESGMEAAVKFLAQKKHRNIAMINGPDNLLASKERLDGYMNALQKLRIKIDLTAVVSSNLSREGNQQAIQEILDLKRRPTAIITFNDYVAMDAIRYAKKAGIRINEDICFVSFANEPITNYMDNPPLASVEQFPYKQGEKATEILLQLLEDDKKSTTIHKILLPPELVIHEAR
ncbi:LacI family DNA-binding transcriptional regulator [Chitinophaga sp. 212800010-3]|uniref:LacI family DNA-binding transcriptional regulator n=1 Tax=unclassified Chitinophaga TaxID=2619133 RepID=UPI002DF4D26B|nr:LacI family transcriptional regulator [Chitinophaga sp. 212800010-3]